jgi:hypothetical protein
MTFEEVLEDIFSINHDKNEVLVKTFCENILFSNQN